MADLVLIVDDDPVIQLLLKVNFELDGFEVMTANNGEDGLALARQHRPDLLLLDVKMPKLDGVAVLQALRSDPDPAVSGLVIVLLSASMRNEDRQAGLAAGATAYVTKPFEPLTLLADVKNVLRPTTRLPF